MRNVIYTRYGNIDDSVTLLGFLGVHTCWRDTADDGSVTVASGGKGAHHHKETHL